jgi:magnesium-transporting ATPase (P-type)
MKTLLVLVTIVLALVCLNVQTQAQLTHNTEQLSVWTCLLFVAVLALIVDSAIERKVK